MKIALIGYGKMGREIEKTALASGHEITLIIDNEQDWQEKQSRLRECDVAIEFTAPPSAPDNIKRCLEAGIPVVTGTTGWFGHLEEIKALCHKLNGTLFYASNFSLGVNMVFEINRRLAKLMNKVEGYEVSIREVHHARKLDAPSGTAITLAQGITENFASKVSWSLQPASDSEIHIESVREGEVTGVHQIIWDSEIDTITISHEAKSRLGFVKGALAAAAFVTGKKGVFTMDHLLAG